MAIRKVEVRYISNINVPVTGVLLSITTSKWPEDIFDHEKEFPYEVSEIKAVCASKLSYDPCVACSTGVEFTYDNTVNPEGVTLEDCIEGFEEAYKLKAGISDRPRVGNCVTCSEIIYMDEKYIQLPALMYMCESCMNENTVGGNKDGNA